MNIAIVLVAYKRKDSLIKLLSSIEKADFQNDEVPLYISIDKSDTTVVVDFANQYDWKYGKKTVLARPVRLGLRKHILSIGDILTDYDALIVLEDDLVVSSNFYNYTKAAVEKYHKNQMIAGISLYSFPVNYHNQLPFYPVKNEFDAFMMQVAQSWGQVWMKDQWRDFINWYNNNSQEFSKEPHLPASICCWPKTSWLKYHSRYCIENNKYFVYPYISLSTNNSDTGEHQRGGNNLYQAVLQMGIKHNYLLPTIDEAICYDGFFENELIKSILCVDDICIDLYAYKNNSLKSRYWLTTKKANYKIMKSYAIQYLPLEQNIIENNVGSNIYLYDTHVTEKFNGNYNSRFLVGKTLYRIKTSLRFLDLYGVQNVLFDLYCYFKRKILKS